MIAPGAVVSDVHALLTLAGRFHQSPVHINRGQLEERVGLLLPDALADLVEDSLQRGDVRLGEAAAEVAGRSRVRDAAGAQSIEKIHIVAPQFDVFETAALA